MDAHIRNAIIIGSAAIVLLALWLVVAGIVWRHFSLRVSLIVLLGFSFLMSIIWWLAGSQVFFLFLGFNPDYVGQPEDYVSRWTFFLTFKLCYVFPSLENWLGSEFCNHISPFLVGTVIAFILGLLPAIVVKRKTERAS